VRTSRSCCGCGRAFEAGRYARWGPCCRWKQRGPAKKYQWTPERDAILRERYDSSVRGRAAEIGRSLGFPRWHVKRRARQLGLAHPRAAWQDWTSAEVAFLEEHAGSRHVNWISKQLGRSLTSVILKLKRLHISRLVREGYTLRDLELCLGMDHRRIEQLVDAGKLRAAHRGEVHRERWVFTDEAVLDFVREHPTAFRLDRVEQLWFLDLVFRGRIGKARTRNGGRTEAA
jgi:hypothetical protein